MQDRRSLINSLDSFFLVKKIQHQGGGPRKVFSSMSAASVRIVILEQPAVRGELEDGIAHIGSIVVQCVVPQAVVEYPVDVDPDGTPPVPVGRESRFFFIITGNRQANIIQAAEATAVQPFTDLDCPLTPRSAFST